VQALTGGAPNFLAGTPCPRRRTRSAKVSGRVQPKSVWNEIYDSHVYELNGVKYSQNELEIIYSFEVERASRLIMMGGLDRESDGIVRADPNDTVTLSHPELSGIEFKVSELQKAAADRVVAREVEGMNRARRAGGPRKSAPTPTGRRRLLTRPMGLSHEWPR